MKLYVFAFNRNSGVTYCVFLKILKSRATSGKDKTSLYDWRRYRNTRPWHMHRVVAFIFLDLG